VNLPWLVVDPTGHCPAAPIALLSQVVIINFMAFTNVQTFAFGFTCLYFVRVMHSSKYMYVGFLWT
jgi:hypothetical protein